MSFCRECGKQVEDDWVSCPFCSQPIGPPASGMLDVQDSVVLGDINIGNSQNLECSNCMSVGAPIIACTECSELCACTLCNDEYLELLSAQLFGEFESSKLNETELKINCLDCAKEIAATICNKSCTHCTRRFEFPDSKLRGNLDEEAIDEWCQLCNDLNSIINSSRNIIKTTKELLSHKDIYPEQRSFHEEELKEEIEELEEFEQMWNDFGTGNYYS